MNRRKLLQTAALGSLACLTPLRRAAAASSAALVSRVRPGEAGWPSEAQWAELGRAVGGRLSALTSALDGRPAGSACRNIFWTANLPESGHFIHGFESVWLPAALLRGEARDRLVDALFAASRNWSVECPDHSVFI